MTPCIPGAIRLVPPSAGSTVFLLVAFLAGMVRAQTGDLEVDLADLNIRHRTEHYALAGTVTEDRLVEYGRCLEYIHKEYATGFAELLERPADQAPTSKKGDKDRRPSRKSERSAKKEGHSRAFSADGAFKVVILATVAQYREFGEAYFGGRAEHTRGLFVPSAQRLLIRDEPASHQTYEVLFHEAFHQFAHRYVRLMPVWLNEGLATYFGTARPTKDGLVFDRPRSAYFGVVKDGRAVGKLIPLDELILSSGSTFYGREPIEGLSHDRTSLSYAQSYTLVAYILQDRPGRNHLREYIRALAGARSVKDTGQITRQHFDDKLLRAMVPPWLDYVYRH